MSNYCAGVNDTDAEEFNRALSALRRLIDGDEETHRIARIMFPVTPDKEKDGAD
ncbi:hypothetical protein LCGC14_1897980 [marine sediment metagenome]|uniref:Uncharacterized protein n=1 Tax=marine sediment metagenome TaxID=412755 RepID=A0A0F9IVG4_9ZZZZ